MWRIQKRKNITFLLIIYLNIKHKAKKRFPTHTHGLVWPGQLLKKKLKHQKILLGQFTPFSFLFKNKRLHFALSKKKVLQRKYQKPNSFFHIRNSFHMYVCVCTVILMKVLSIILGVLENNLLDYDFWAVGKDYYKNLVRNSTNKLLKFLIFRKEINAGTTKMN